MQLHCHLYFWRFFFQIFQIIKILFKYRSKKDNKLPKETY